MTSNWNKFVLLMWKNWRIHMRHKKQLAIVILLPALFAILLLLLRNDLVLEVFPQSTRFPPVKVNFRMSDDIIENIKKLEISYYPKCKCLDGIAVYVENWLNNNNELPLGVDFKLVGYNTEAEINHNEIIAAVQFNISFVNAVECPKTISYSIRFPNKLRRNYMDWIQDETLRIIVVGSRVGILTNFDDNPSYYLEGFIGIQHAFAMGFIDNFKMRTDYQIPEILIRRFPYPPHNRDYLLRVLTISFNNIVALSFSYLCCQIVRHIAVEKERQLKEIMKIMGLPNWLHWTAWFITFYLQATIIATLIVLILKVKLKTNIAVLSHCDWTILFFFLQIYGMSSITYSFMMATFYSKDSSTVFVTGLLWSMSYNLNVKFGRQIPSLGAQLFFTILPNTGLGFASLIITQLEASGEGLQWNNIFRPADAYAKITIGHIIIMLIFDSILYMLIALYVEKMFSGSYGIPEKWYFPFAKLKKYLPCKKLFRKTSTDIVVDSETNKHEMRTDSAAFEPEPKNKKIGVSIKRLGKKFGKKTAVNNLSMNLYEDEITVLLGHNGAGKTTTISMLTGMITPTNGTAILNGYDIITHWKNARMSLGLCPQHNILFNELTVGEHIEFFSRLRGMSKTTAKLEIQKYVKLLELENKINVQSKKLSGGMKRKLCVASALCGGSKIVICDKSTSGMDPEARRQFCDLLEVEKRGRTILLSTLFTEEADVIGDRIAIMCNGELKAHGTSFFLKKKYGAGYHLICVKDTDCQPDDITEVLRQFIPDVVVETETDIEVSYILKEKYADRFEKLLLELENKSSDLKINGFGISHTTLEEIFMLVGSDREAKRDSDNRKSAENSKVYEPKNDKKKKEKENSSEHGTALLVNDSISESNKFLSGTKLTLSQWKAMLLKKYLYAKRNYIVLVIQTFMPVLIISFSMILSQYSYFPKKPFIQLDIKRLFGTVTVLESKGLPGIANEYRMYVESFGSNHKLVEIEENFEDYVLKLEKKNLLVVNTKYVIGTTIGLNNITAWFNAEFYHALPVSLNAIYNAILRSVTNDSTFTIEVKCYPFPQTVEMKMESVHKNFKDHLPNLLSSYMSFVTAFYIIFQIKERVSRAKLLQFVSGVRPFTFWVSQFIFDYGNYLFIAIATITTIACCQILLFSTTSEIGRMFCILAVFGFSSIAVTYLLAFCFTDSATGYTTMLFINIVTGVGFANILNLIRVIDLKQFVTKKIYSLLNSIFLIFPHYFLLESLFAVGEISRNTTLFSDYFDWEYPGIGGNIFCTFMVFAVISIVLMIKEYRLFQTQIFRIQQFIFEVLLNRKSRVRPSSQLDEDVKEENLRVSRMSPKEIKNTNLVLDHVSKYYWKCLAVNNISLAVKHSECFGLLGVNGSGKTTIFEMLIGDKSITYGDAYVKGLSVKKELRVVRKEISYCPQVDELLEDLTGREILHIFALFCGVPKHRIKTVSEELAEGFEFTKYLDKPAKTYSDGNKRKLSTSIGLIGNPSIIYLDEPTSGMDRGIKQQLWNQISKIRNSGKSVVLTSHRMEECEALCTRLAIMVNGEFQCIGSVQHLKNKFCKGLILKIKISKNEENQIDEFSSRVTRGTQRTSDYESGPIIDFIKEKFEGVELKQHYQRILTFYIPQKTVQWSKIFGIMEAHKEHLYIEDYSIRQSTLEEVFLEVVKNQRNDYRILQ